MGWQDEVEDAAASGGTRWKRAMVLALLAAAGIGVAGALLFAHSAATRPAIDGLYPGAIEGSGAQIREHLVSDLWQCDGKHFMNFDNPWTKVTTQRGAPECELISSGYDMASGIAADTSHHRMWASTCPNGRVFTVSWSFRINTGSWIPGVLNDRAATLMLAELEAAMLRDGWAVESKAVDLGDGAAHRHLVGTKDEERIHYHLHGRAGRIDVSQDHADIRACHPTKEEFERCRPLLSSIEAEVERCNALYGTVRRDACIDRLFQAGTQVSGCEAAWILSLTNGPNPESNPLFLGFRPASANTEVH